MSASFALPGAVRLPRTAMARRALLVTLFLGGLMGLALLFGGSAQAAESDGSPGAKKLLAPAAEMHEKTKKHFSEAAEREADQSAERRKAVKDAVAETVRPITDRTERITRPVRDLVEDTTDAAGLPVDLPENERGGDNGQGTGRQTGHAPADKGGSTGAGTDSARTGFVSAPTVSQDSGAGAAEQARAAGDENRGGLPAQLPQAPAPVGGSASQHAGDGNGPRGGDANAATASGAPRFGLVAGAIRAASTTPTRDRSSEILEFPG
ncbi:hypothetical protein [Streptomyces sp. NPDC047108]|uniref:hypothetical protein n=1 Tax=Streptomyces sp. NPDC047108 TaxID=3155025 RepID=UPI0033D4FFC6